jgi:hypothetical protein
LKDEIRTNKSSPARDQNGIAHVLPLSRDSNPRRPRQSLQRGGAVAFFGRLFPFSIAAATPQLHQNEFGSALGVNRTFRDVNRKALFLNKIGGFIAAHAESRRLFLFLRAPISVILDSVHLV